MGNKKKTNFLLRMKCPICLNEEFVQINVLKPRLIKEWNLSDKEVDYINKQQGFQCTKCRNNLRSMTLASGIMNHYGFSGFFRQFPLSNFGNKLKVLEINEAGGLHSILKNFKKYVFAYYPKIDIQKLPYDNNSFDLIVHSDTLEHVKNSYLAIKECYRVLKNNGVMIYTVPIVFSRLTKQRDGLPNSYHGSQDESQGEDFKVYTEYGADFWVEIINAGFKEVKINTITNLDSISICARKFDESNFVINKVCFFKYYLKRFIRKLKNIL